MSINDSKPTRSQWVLPVVIAMLAIAAVSFAAMAFTVVPALRMAGMIVLLGALTICLDYVIVETANRLRDSAAERRASQNQSIAFPTHEENPRRTPAGTSGPRPTSVIKIPKS